MMIDAIVDNNWANVLWTENGGNWYDPKDYLSVYLWCRNLQDTVPYAITVNTKKGKVGICHAEPPHTNGNNWIDNVTDEDNLHTMLWGRTNIMHGLPSNYSDVYATYHGHTPTTFVTGRPAEVVTLGSAHYIDTACVLDGKLTLMEIK